MPVPDVFRQFEDEPGILIHGALIEWVGAQIAVHIAGFEICDHLRRGNHPDLNILIRMHSPVREKIPQ